MTVTAPPRRPDSHDAEFTVEPDRSGEALIEEAKQHARLRRRRVAVTAIVASLAIAGAVTAALVAGGTGSSSSRPSSQVGAEVPVAGTTAVEHVDAVASWAKIHTGWVMIFSDGRVLVSHDTGPVRERWLSPAGLDLVQSGQVTALDVRSNTFDSASWAVARYTEYVAAEYAACPRHGEPQPNGTWISASTALVRLPHAVRAVVRGTQRTIFGFEFDTFLPSGMVTPPADWRRGTACFALSPGQASAIALVSDERSAGIVAPVGEWSTLTFTPDGGEPIEVVLIPMLPDGRVLFWGG